MRMCFTIRREMEHKEENFLILEVFEKVVKHSQIISLMYLLNQTCVFINLFDGNYFNKMFLEENGETKS